MPLTSTVTLVTLPLRPDTVIFDGYRLALALSFMVIAVAFAKFAGVHAGVPVKVAVGVFVEVAVFVGVPVLVLVAVFVGVLVEVAVPVAVGVPLAHGSVIVSIRMPACPAAIAPLSV